MLESWDDEGAEMQKAQSGEVAVPSNRATLARAIMRMSPERMARWTRPDRHSPKCQGAFRPIVRLNCTVPRFHQGTPLINPFYEKMSWNWISFPQFTDLSDCYRMVILTRRVEAVAKHSPSLLELLMIDHQLVSRAAM